MSPDVASRARIALVADLRQNPALAVAPASSLRLRVRRLNGTAALDTTLSFAPETESVELTATVPLELTAPSDPPMERLVVLATFYGEAMDSLFSSGPDTMDVFAGAENSVTPSLRYVGTGFDAESLHIDPRGASLSVGDQFTFSATAFDSSGNAIAQTPVLWSVLEPLVVSLPRPDSGRVTVGPAAGTGRLVARTLTGQADTVTLTVSALPAIQLSQEDVQFRAGYRGTDPEERTIYISNGGGGALVDLSIGEIQYAGSSNWLTASLDSLSAPTPLRFFVDIDSLGLGTHTATVPVLSSVATNSPRTVTVTVVVEDRQVAVAVGGDHACALSAAGMARCWGRGLEGQLGIGGNSGTPEPTLVAGGIRFQSLGAANNHTCGLSTEGAAYCWGQNDRGELGDGTGVDQTVPVAVQGGHVFNSLAVSAAGACGLTASGTAHCWGYNSSGAVGDGSSANRLAPVLVQGGLTFRSLGAGYVHNCGITDAGESYCWGYNALGQLGDGTTVTRFAPQLVLGGHEFQAISGWGAFNPNLSTCGLIASGAAYCWGGNPFGQLGSGTTMSTATPVPVAGGIVFSQLSAGPTHTCGLSNAGAAFCWGWNFHGQLGDGTTDDRLVPTAVLGGHTFQSISARGGGSSFPGRVCGVTTSGEVYCWGGNFQTTPVLIPVP
jgi:alpha-tubulin suppressor-like RCC1 family protein